MNDDDEVIDNLLDEAEALERRGLRLEAMHLLHNASSLRTDALVLTRIGALATDLHRWSEAEAALQDAIALESDFAPAHVYLGLLFQAQGRLGEALKSLKTASLLETSAINYTVMGVVQADLDLKVEAQRSFERAISLDPAYEEAYYNLATILRDDDKECAMLLLKKAIDIDPNYAMAHRELGRLFLNEDLPEAEYHVRRAIELAPHDGWAHIYLGNLLWRSKDLDPAEAAFRKAIEVWPDRSVPYWCLAYFLERQDRQQEARNLYQRALEVDPDDAQANRRFGSYLKDIGHFEEAKSYLLSAIYLNPADKQAAAMLAKVEKQLNPG